MLVAKASQEVTIPFVYKSGYDFVDPSANISVFLRRGFSSGGAVIVGPQIFYIDLALASTPEYKQVFQNGSSITRVSEGSYILVEILPANIFPGQYTIAITTTLNGVFDIKEIPLTIQKGATRPEDWSSTPNYDNYSMVDKSVSLSERSKYRQIGQFETNNILLIGHTDAIEPYGIQKIRSIQEAVDILRADYNSPLLKGVFDAYSCGARDIYIMSCGYMSEYVENVLERNVKIFQDITNETFSFYEAYYHRLAECYTLIEQYEFIDIIVPLETSMINTGTVNFVNQLSFACNSIQENTGEITIGIIGSRNQGMSSEDISTLLSKDFQIPNSIDFNGYITKDYGKHILLVYGEVVFNHKQMERSYTSSVAAAVAGMLSSTQVNMGLSKKRIPSALSIYGNDPNSSEVRSLSEKGINCITRGGRSRRFGGQYDIYLSGDLTKSISENFKDSSNVRLAAMLIGEVQAIGNNAIGKFNYQKASGTVDSLLKYLKQLDIVRDYQLEIYGDKQEKGKMYYNITVQSSRTLREISFNVATGKGI